MDPELEVVEQDQPEEETLDQKIETLRKFRELLQQPGWDELVRIGTAQAGMRRHKWSHSFLTGEDQKFEQQWMLGEASGMDALMRLPNMIVADYEVQVKELVDAEEAKRKEQEDVGEE